MNLLLDVGFPLFGVLYHTRLSKGISPLSLPVFQFPTFFNVQIFSCVEASGNFNKHVLDIAFHLTYYCYKTCAFYEFNVYLFFFESV